MDDNTMMNLLGQDDEQWYSALIDRYTPYVTAIISGIAKGSLTAADVEEVAADVFYKIWLKRAQIRPDSVKAYIARVTRNAGIDRLRLKGMEFLPYEDDVLQIACGERPDELAIVKEQTQILQEAVTSFGEPEREIFIRFYYFGETIEAISQKLRLNSATTKTKLHRLRLKLRTILGERGYGCEER